MSVFDEMLTELERAGRSATPGEIVDAQVEHGDFKVRVRSDAYDRLGVRVHELSVEGPTPSGELGEVLRRQARALTGLEGGPLPDLNLQEVDEKVLGGGILRTAPRSMHRGYFYEATLDGGHKVSVHRHRRDAETGERSDAPFVASEESLSELVETLGGALKLPPAEVG